MSHHRPVFSIALLLCALVFASVTRANDEHPSEGTGKLHAITGETAAWAAKAKANYPTSLCIVSGENLSTDPEEAYDFIYRETGKPDRFISFCCDGCSKDFGMDPKRFLQKLDEAAASKK